MDEKSVKLQFEWIGFHKKNGIYVGFIECNQAGFRWWYFPNQNGFFHVFSLIFCKNENGKKMTIIFDVLK